jgi:hypothetical protein
MAYARQYDTRLDIGQMTPSGEIGALGRICRVAAGRARKGSP